MFLKIVVVNRLFSSFREFPGNLLYFRGSLKVPDNLGDSSFFLLFQKFHDFIFNGYLCYLYTHLLLTIEPSDHFCLTTILPNFLHTPS